jgi:hypothetical protein
MLLLRFAEGGIDIDLSLGALPFEDEVVDRWDEEGGPADANSSTARSELPR